MGRYNRQRSNKKSKKKENKKIFIFAEGEKTEKIYFERFNYEVSRKLKRAGVITVHGLGCNTLSLVKKAIYLIEKEDFNYKIDEKWVVFDKDDFKSDQFDNAISKAEQNGFKVGWSNECFELWYLLHFEKFNNNCDSRKEYYQKLTQHLKTQCPDSKIHNYEKDGKSIDLYEFLKPFQNKAIKNAKWLEGQSNPPYTPSKTKPYSTVFKLVTSIKSIKR